MSRSVRSRFLCSAFGAALVASTLAIPACDRLSGSASSGTAASLKEDQVELLLAALAQAPTHGFQPGAFGELGLARQLKDGNRSARERLRAAALAYARALHGQSIPTRDLDPMWGVKRPAYDAEADFIQAARNGQLKAWAGSLAPASPQYLALREGYASYLKLRAAGGWRALPGSGELRIGASGPDVAALRQRLAAEDPTAATAAPDDRFDPTLAQAVQRAQQRYGLHPTGVVDADLRAALNVPLDARLAQIRANLERLRWLPRRAEPDRIEVNTAAGLVDVYRGGAHTLHMLAAAGKPGDETPILVSAVESVVLNPTWNVPDGIAEKEILPKGADYLQRLGFVENSAGAGVRLTQKPGPQNALGQVKFLFDNPYAVYLHDTPARAAFARERRSVSHGCVRLERAVDLARLLLSTEPGWSPQRVDEVLAGSETTEVKLRKPVPVLLVYMTAFAANGGIAFRPDVYGWDVDVLRRLDAQRPGVA